MAQSFEPDGRKGVRNREKGTIAQWFGIVLVFVFLLAALWLIGDIP